MILLFAACGEEEQEITVQSIAISQPSAELVIGETLSLKATVSPSNASYDGITWTSTKTTVATVSGSGQVSALAEGNTTITAMAGGKTATCSITVVKGYVAVSSISLNKEGFELIEGDSAVLTATVSPEDATDKTVTWSSTNTGVATVNDGTITAIKEGEATITAKAGDKTASCKVVVQKKAGLEAIDLGLSVKWASCNLGATIPEEAGDYFAWGEITTYYSSINPLVWRSGREGGYFWPSYKWCRGSYNTLTKYCSDPSYGYNGFTDYKTTLDPEDDAAFAQLGDKWRIPTISEIEELLNKCSWVWTSVNGIKGYKVTGSNGNSIFLPASGFWYEKLLEDVGVSGLYWSSNVYNGIGRYSLEFYPEYKGSRGFGFYYGHQIRPVYGNSTSSIPVQSVSLDKSQLDLTVGQTYTFTTTVKPSNATDKSVTWSSSNSSVATVSSSGVVTAKATGKATITVKTNDGGITATCSVTVNASTVVTGVSLNKTSMLMSVGDAETLIATVSPSNAPDKSVYWSSSNTSVATVSPSGVVSARACGNASITVKTYDGGKTATCSVSVIIDQDKAIAFIDKSIKKDLVAAFDKNKDGEISYSEAAAITSSDDLKSALRSTDAYTSFNEFQFFTGIKVLASEMFKGWTSLKSITLPTTLTSIASMSFMGCSSIKTLIIPESVSSIGDHAFASCKSLTSINIPNAVNSINEGVFNHCTSLTSIVIPDSVTSVGVAAFYGCKSLKNISIPESVSFIGAHAFRECESLTSFQFPKAVKQIASYVLFSCKSLTTVTMPSSPTMIRACAFQKCLNLDRITIPDTVYLIENYAFEGCESLTGISLPKSVSRIGYEAFYKCKSFKSIKVYREAPPAGDEGMFLATGDCAIYVPRYNVSSYIEAQYWKDYASRIKGM